jgi:hypothetical protein
MRCSKAWGQVTTFIDRNEDAHSTMRSTYRACAMTLVWGYFNSSQRRRKCSHQSSEVWIV